MATDHVLITLSDFKQICTDLKRTGDLIKGVVRVTHEAKKTKRKQNAKLYQSKEASKAKKRKSPSGDESSGSRRKSRRSKSPTKPESEPN